jgi:hypothetical protein
MTHQSPIRRAVLGAALIAPAANGWTDHADAYRAAVAAREAATPTNWDNETQHATWEAKVGLVSDALKAACKHPAPTLAALVEKCDMLSSEYPDADCLDGYDCSYVMADVRRLASPAATVEVDRAKWDSAYAVMEAARAADDAHNAFYEAADFASKAILVPEWERLGGVVDDARWALFEIPAPDKAALLWKSEMLFGESADNGAGSHAWSPGIMTTYMADARRLLAGEIEA